MYIIRVEKEDGSEVTERRKRNSREALEYLHHSAAPSTFVTIEDVNAGYERTYHVDRHRTVRKCSAV